MRGDGAMPSIALSGPTVFGDQGGQWPGCMLKDSFRGHTTETPTPVIVDELMMADVMLADGCCFYYIFLG